MPRKHHDIREIENPVVMHVGGIVVHAGKVFLGEQKNQSEVLQPYQFVTILMKLNMKLKWTILLSFIEKILII